MKIPIEWLKQYIETSKNSKELAASFTQLGLLLDKPVEKYEDTNYTTEVLDLEHRMDRADWLSVLGCARDLAAFENIKLKYPEIYTEELATTDKKIEVKVEDKGFVNRFYTHVIEGITVSESPEWLKNRLQAYGMPSINNIVDITNYVMLEYGQPMHAHDIDKMEKPEIVFRKATNGEKIQTLLGQIVELDTETHITTNNNKPTGIGGIVGGTMVAIDQHTKNIVLDAGNYNQTVIRKTSRRLKIQNETVARTDKFLHPNSTELAVKRATKLILELAGGIAYFNGDYYPEIFNPKIMDISYNRLQKLGGMDFDSETVKRILQNLEYKLINETSEKLTFEIPYFRTDIEVEDDLVADVLRINDYSKIPVKNMHMAPPKEITPKIYDFEEKLKDILVGLGLHEHITDPIVEALEEDKKQIRLLNALNAEKNALRTSIFETLVPILNTYKKHRKNEIGIFEIGKEYHHENEEYAETRTLGVIYEKEGLSAYETVLKTKRILAALLQNVGVENYTLEKNGNTAFIKIDNQIVGELGHGRVKIYTEKLLPFEMISQRVVSQITNNIVENLSLVVDKNTEFGEVIKYIKDFNPYLIDVDVIEEYILESLGPDKKAILLKLVFTTNETAQIRQSLLLELKARYGISHRE